MTKDEWLSIGYSNHVIEDVPSDASVRFSVVYAQWYILTYEGGYSAYMERINYALNNYIDRGVK